MGKCERENNPEGYPWNREQFKGDKRKWAQWWLEFHYLHHAMNDDDIETEMFCREMMKVNKAYDALKAENSKLREALGPFGKKASDRADIKDNDVEWHFGFTGKELIAAKQALASGVEGEK